MIRPWSEYARFAPDTISEEDGVCVMTSDNEWPTLREKTVYEESKQVMEAQKSDIDDIDDKALRTVRITAILLAVGATGVEVIGLDAVNTTVGIISIACFLLSLVFGVIVYNESNELIGPKASYLRKMREEDLEKPWDEDFLYQLEGWVEENQITVEFNGYLLIVCQSFFVAGVEIGVFALLGLNIGEIILGVFVLSIIVLLIFGVIKSEVNEN